jgi:RNA polymerase sigma-70 factor, ECF subfamily
LNGDAGVNDDLPRPLTSSDAADGCAEARFEDWYRDHYERLRSLCARILSDPSAAEDIAQETLLRAWLGKDRVREQDVGAWLSVVARNLCVSHMRRRWRAVPHDILPDAPDYEADPAFEAERSETRRSVRHALSQVGDRHRRLLVRREVGGADYAELGEELGLTPSGARAVLFRARRSLRDRLAAVGEGLGAWVAGIRVKVVTAGTRVRDAVHSLEAGGIFALQAGMSLAVATGLALSAGLGGAQGNFFDDTALDRTRNSTSVAASYRASDSLSSTQSDQDAGSPRGSSRKIIRNSYSGEDGSSTITVDPPGPGTPPQTIRRWHKDGENPSITEPWFKGERWLECWLTQRLGCNPGGGEG